MHYAKITQMESDDIEKNQIAGFASLNTLIYSFL